MAEATWVPSVGDQVRVKDARSAFNGEVTEVLQSMSYIDGYMVYRVKLRYTASDKELWFQEQQLEPVAAAQPAPQPMADGGMPTQSIIDVILREMAIIDPTTQHDARTLRLYIDHLRERIAALEAALKQIANIVDHGKRNHRLAAIDAVLEELLITPTDDDTHGI